MSKVLVLYYSAWGHVEKMAEAVAETYNAVKPGLATLPGSMLIGISSPYRKSGLLYTKYKKHFDRACDPSAVAGAEPDARSGDHRKGHGR
jgi:hypothetical protein